MLDGRLDALPTAPTLDDLQQQVENAPALRRARLEIERRMALTELEKARRIPDLTVIGGEARGSARPQTVRSSACRSRSCSTATGATC